MTKPLPLFNQLMDIRKTGYLVQITDEDLATAQVWPVTIPTAEERAAAKLERAREAARERLQVEQRLAQAHPALQPVIAHHSPAEHGFLYSWTCKGCDTGAYAEDSPSWPCSTLELILEGLG